MANSFDVDFSIMVEERLKEKGVNVLTNTLVEEIIGDGKVEKVGLKGGKEISIDAVILGVGAKPNVSLAVDAGFDIG